MRYQLRWRQHRHRVHWRDNPGAAWLGQRPDVRSQDVLVNLGEVTKENWSFDNGKRDTPSRGREIRTFDAARRGPAGRTTSTCRERTRVAQRLTELSWFPASEDSRPHFLWMDRNGPAIMTLF
jgi:hypothetical protein